MLPLLNNASNDEDNKHQSANLKHERGTATKLLGHDVVAMIVLYTSIGRTVDTM